MKLEEALQMKPFPNDIMKAHLNIMYTASWLKNQLLGRLRPYQLSHEQFNVLRILRGQYPEFINQKGILCRMIDKNSNITRIISKLKERELVEVERSETDKRAYEIRIHQNGLDLLLKIDEERALLEPNLSELTDQEAVLLNALLDKMRVNERK